MLLELLDERGLVSALRSLCAAYSERLAVVVDADLEAVEVASPADLAMLRIAQEGLSNAVRDSEAERITLRLRRCDDGVELGRVGRRPGLRRGRIEGGRARAPPHAGALRIREETVKSHVSSILSKLHLADRYQAAIFAPQRHLVPLDEALD